MKDTCRRATNGTLVCDLADLRALQDQWDADVVAALPEQYREVERASRAAWREHNVKALCPRYGLRYQKTAQS